MAPDRAADESEWRQVLIEGYEPLTRARRVFRRLPSDPRCKLCSNPFGGIGGRAFRVMGFRPSRKNPNLCTKCCDNLGPGGIEVDIAVLFADMRGSTSLGERHGPTEFAGLLNRFYAAATRVLLAHDALIDKLIGDEVMALFIPGIAGPAYRARAVDAAVALQGALADEGLDVGTAVSAGVAYVGNVGETGVVDFTALGDPVNTAARLQAEAAPGEVVLQADLYGPVADRHPGATNRTVAVRGKADPVEVCVIPA